jgi:D-alanyl-D-alanine carboxypeptidase (penicillin-binding protein 5/6)
MIEKFVGFVLNNPKVRLGLVAMAILLVSMPGQNRFQTLSLSNNASKIQEVLIEEPEVSDIPIPKADIYYPYLTARGAIVIDVGSGAILYEKSPDAGLMPASTTKIMTAMVAMDEYDLNDIVTVDNESQSIGHVSELVSGERITVKDLLYAMLVSSGNDAALALGQHHPDGYQGFVDSMNQKAEQLNLNNTHYRNVSGLEQYDHYSSVRDLAILTKEAMRKDLFRQIVATESIKNNSVDGDLQHTFRNINELLGEVEGIRGVKTGWTQNAGECLVTSTVRNGHEVIVVVLGSENRFEESITLIEWAFNSHNWEEI